MGDRRGRFERFFQDHYPLVRQYAARRFGADDADDIAQETMIRAFRHFDEIDESRAAQPWLATIARHVGVDSSRRRRSLTVDSTVLAEIGPSVPDESTDVATRVDLGELLRNAMNRLSDHDREVLTLHEVCGVEIRDIAAHAGMSPNTIRQRLFRARHNLQRHYRELGGSEYAVLPVAPGAPRRLHQPVDYVVRAVHRLSPHARHQPAGRVAAVAAVVAMTSVFAPSSQRPPGQAAPPAVSVPRVPVAPPGLHAAPPGIPLDLNPASVRLLAGLPGVGPVRLPYVEDWEAGLGAWSVSGKSASLDCLSPNRFSGLCSLRLDPRASVTVRRPFDLPLRSTVRATYAARGEQGRVSFDLALGATSVRVALDPRRRTLDVESPGAEPASISLVAQEWYQIVVTVDPATRTVEVAQSVYAYGYALTPAVVTLPEQPDRIRSVAFTATGRGPLWLDQFGVLLDRPACADGVDNDGDGDVDQQDSGCFSLFDDTESPNPQCSDGEDNDGDGLTDLRDPTCTYTNASTESSGCSNGVDDDGDGHADYPDDGKCTSESDDSELPTCGDGRDNDGDGQRDYPAELGCSGPGDDTEWSCAVVHVDSRGMTPPVVENSDVQRRPFPAGVCLDPLARLGEPLHLVGQAPAGPVRGHVNLYRLAGHEFPCAVLAHDGADPCTAFGASFVRRLAALVRAGVEPQPSSGATGSVYLCTATVIVAARVYSSPLGRGEQALTLC